MLASAYQWFQRNRIYPVKAGLAVSRLLRNPDDTGQVFVFFILTVAAAEAAIGLAILVVLFRNRRSINVQELNTMKG